MKLNRDGIKVSACSQRRVVELHHAPASSHDGRKQAAGLRQQALHDEAGRAELRLVETVAVGAILHLRQRHRCGARPHGGERGQAEEAQVVGRCCAGLFWIRLAVAGDLGRGPLQVVERLGQRLGEWRELEVSGPLPDEASDRLKELAQQAAAIGR